MERIASAAVSPYFRCPRGSYLAYSPRTSAEQLLARSQRDHFAAGWQPVSLPSSDWRGPFTDRHYYVQRGLSVWCSDNWPNPATCARDSLPHYMPDYVYHETTPSGAVGAPVRSVFGSKVEFIHNYKAASGSVAAFLACAYGRETYTDTFEASVFVVRDPIDRFVSGVGELLRRYVNDHCPEDADGPVQCSHSLEMSPAYTALRADRSDFRAVREETLAEASSSTRWWPLAKSKGCLLYTSPSPRDRQKSRMPSSA